MLLYKSVCVVTLWKITLCLEDGIWCRLWLMCLCVRLWSCSCVVNNEILCVMKVWVLASGRWWRFLCGKIGDGGSWGMEEERYWLSSCWRYERKWVYGFPMKTGGELGPGGPKERRENIDTCSERRWELAWPRWKRTPKTDRWCCAEFPGMQNGRGMGCYRFWYIRSAPWPVHLSDDLLDYYTREYRAR